MNVLGGRMNFLRAFELTHVSPKEGKGWEMDHESVNE